jgi:hypothetical protein
MRSGLMAMAVLALLVAATTTLWGEGPARCAHCGCQADCHKVCRLVCEEKKVQVTCWGCKYENMCLPGPSTPGCEHCDTLCDEPDKSGKGPDCVKPKDFVWKEWIPGCATIHTKTKLMKKTVTKKVPSFKWVVEDLCQECQAKAEQADRANTDKAKQESK